MQQVMNAVWSLLYKNVNTYTQGWMIFRNIIRHNTLCRHVLAGAQAPHNKPCAAMTCSGSMKWVDGDEGWTLKEEWTVYHELNKHSDEIYESWLIKRELCVRAPRLARQGAHSMFITTPKIRRESHRRAPSCILELNSIILHSITCCCMSC